MHSGTAIAIRDVPAAASHGTAGVLAGCQGSGCFSRRAAEDSLSSGWAGEAVRPPCYLLVVVLDVERACGGGLRVQLCLCGVPCGAVWRCRFRSLGGAACELGRRGPAARGPGRHGLLGDEPVCTTGGYTRE